MNPGSTNLEPVKCEAKCSLLRIIERHLKGKISNPIPGKWPVLNICPVPSPLVSQFHMCFAQRWWLCCSSTMLSPTHLCYPVPLHIPSLHSSVKDVVFLFAKELLPPFSGGGTAGKGKKAARKSSNPNWATSCFESRSYLFVIKMGSRGLGKIEGWL